MSEKPRRQPKRSPLYWITWGTVTMGLLIAAAFIIQALR
jgi:hypothetical protein